MPIQFSRVLHIVGTCRVLYKLDGDHAKLQVGLDAEEKRELGTMSMKQLLAELKRAKLAHKEGQSKYLGVRPSGRRWRVRHRRTSSNSRTCDTEVEAARQYDVWALENDGRLDLSPECAQL